MQPITDIYSSLYLTAMGMNTRHHCDDQFDELDGEPPMSKSLFARIRSRLFPAISRILKPGLKAVQGLLADRELRT